MSGSVKGYARYLCMVSPKKTDHGTQVKIDLTKGRCEVRIGPVVCRRSKGVASTEGPLTVPSFWVMQGRWSLI